MRWTKDTDETRRKVQPKLKTGQIYTGNLILREYDVEGAWIREK